MKVEFWCNNGANIHSKRTETFDMGGWGISDEEWREMSDDEKYEMVKEWMYERLDYGWKEL